MRDKVSPFAASSQDTINYYKVDTGGVCYLLVKGGLSPSESPITQQQADNDRATATALRLEAIKSYAKENGMTVGAVQELLKPIPLTDEDGNPILDGKGNQKTEARLDFQPMFYLDKAQAREMLELNSRIANEPYSAATNAVKYRLLHHVTAVTDLKTGRITVRLSPFAELAEGMYLHSLSGQRIKVKEVGEVDEDRCVPLVVATTTISIKTDDDLLIVGSNGKPLVGVPDWTMEDTSDQLLEAQIGDLYAFMMLDSSGATLAAVAGEDEEEEEGGKDQSQLTTKSNDSTGSEKESS